MVIIEKFNSKYSDIFMANSILLKERKLDPRAVIKYANANKNLVLLAVENKEPVGFIIGYSVGNKCSILTIFVQEHSRKKKIGSLLVSGLIQQNLTGLWTVRLRTIDSSIIGFFEKCGFKKITELNLYEKDNTTFVVSHNNNNLPSIFSISVAEQKDIPQLMEIERESFESFWLRTNEEWKIILEDEDAIVFILSGEFENEKKILGFSHNSINGNNGLKEGQYIRIAVNPQYKRTGLATKLTEKAFEFFRRNNVRKIYLSTVKDNEQLNIMYKNWGFHYFDSDTIMGKKMGEIRGK